MDHWYCAHVAGPGVRNINAIDIVTPCPNPKVSQNCTIDIMTSWNIDIVTGLWGHNINDKEATISMAYNLTIYNQILLPNLT